jgi:hypothetical protein
MKNTIVVLNDEETFTSLDGSVVYVLDDENMAVLDETGDLYDVATVASYDLSNPADLRALADRLEKGR